MTFINTDGMSFIGPGSEWFWTALSGIVLAVTFLAIYRQLRLQRGADAIEQLERFEHEYQSERMLRHRLDLRLAQREGVDKAELPFHAVNSVAAYWEKVGSLVRRGYLDLGLILDGGSGQFCHADWVRLAPAIRRDRTEDRNPENSVNFEWLARQIEEGLRQSGTELDDDAKQAAQLDRSIAYYEALIRVEVALRSVAIASPEVATPASLPSPATAEG